MAAAQPLQDMPPAGGYASINYKRVPARTYFNGYTMIAGYLAMTAGAGFVYYLNRKRNHHNEIENRSANFAILPLLLAEKDRMLMRQLRLNREEETELMKNVEGWQVGTWFGEPIYKTQPGYIQPTLQEVYIHSKFSDFAKRAHILQWS